MAPQPRMDATERAPTCHTADMINFRQNYPALAGQAALLKTRLDNAAGDLAAAALDQMPWQGSEADRRIAGDWLILPEPQRVVICAGGNHALLVTALTLGLSGKTVVTEAYTYNGFRSLAASLDIRLFGCDTDKDGLLPERLDAVCRMGSVAAIYVQPTIQNPACFTMSGPRREAIAAIAARYGLPIIEDDAYRFLHDDPPPRFVDLAPALTFSIASLTKPFSPLLKVAYLCLPDGFDDQATSIIRITASGTSALLTYVASEMIASGDLDRVIADKRLEARRRQSIAAQMLAPLPYASHPTSFHLWLPLPSHVSSADLQQHLLQRRVDVSTDTDFRASGSAGAAAIRIAVGAVTDDGALRAGLEQVRLAIMARTECNSAA